MNLSRFFSWLLLFFGEAIIITIFLLSNGIAFDDILKPDIVFASLNSIAIMNIIIASIIYGLYFIDILVPWINFKDKSQSKVGSLGLRWAVTWVYTSLAVVAMICCNWLFKLAFPIQFVVHCVLFFFLLLGLNGAYGASLKVKEINQQKEKGLTDINRLKKAMQKLKNKMYALSDLPDYITVRINKLDENLLYLSPSDNPEAHELEHSFIQAIHSLEQVLSDFPTDETSIENKLRQCEHCYQNRKKCN